MTQWAGVILGVLLMIVGAIILILSFVTKLFYTKVKQAPYAGEALVQISTTSILSDAACTWDETSIVLNTSGEFVKWASTKQYRDAAGESLYTYDLVPSTGTVEVCRSNANTLSVRLNGTAYLTNQRTLAQKWSSFPKFESDETVIIVSSCKKQASSPPSGMSLWHYSDDADISIMGRTFDLNNDFSTASSFLNGSGVTNPVSMFTDSTSQIAGNVVAYPSLNTFYNGSSASAALAFSASSFIASKINANQPKLEIGRRSVKRFINETYHGTIHAIYVFARILDTNEISTVSEILKIKYFSPYLAYPTTITCAVNTQLNVENTLVPGAVPILGYKFLQLVPDKTLLPGQTLMTFSKVTELPSGISFNENTGSITGTPTIVTPKETYSVIAESGLGSTTTEFTLEVTESETLRTATTPPNISFATNPLIARVNERIASAAPVNTGGVVISYSIAPQIPSGIQFDSLTGILTGSSSENRHTEYTVTAQNEGGTSSVKLRLQIGISIMYSSDISGSVGSPIQALTQALTPSVLGVSDTRLDFSYTGDLYGLAFDKVTGSISGTPTSAGTNTITVSLKTTNSPVSTSLVVSIRKAEYKTEFKDKVYYLSAGGVAFGAGAAALGVSLWSPAFKTSK